MQDGTLQVIVNPATNELWALIADQIVQSSLPIIMLVSIWMISTKSVATMITAYRIQTTVICIVIAKIGVKSDNFAVLTWFLPIYAALIWIILVWSFKRILIYATNPDLRYNKGGPNNMCVFDSFYKIIAYFLVDWRFSSHVEIEYLHQIEREACQTWALHPLSGQRQTICVLLGLVLSLLSYGAATYLNHFSEHISGQEYSKSESAEHPHTTVSRPIENSAQVRGSGPTDQQGSVDSVLAVSLSLVGFGLIALVVRPDCVSQIIGLMVIDHGMFISIFRLLDDKTIIAQLVIALFIYIIVTLSILAYLLPQLRHHFKMNRPSTYEHEIAVGSHVALKK